MTVRISGTGLDDANGNEVLKAGSTASAVNEATLTNAATGSGPTLAATGGDTNIPLNLAGKGTGAVQVGSNITGLLTALGFGRRSIALSDANTTLTSAQYDRLILEFTGTLTAGRDVVLPNTESAIFIVFNNGTGQTLTLKVSGQTGVAIANNKTAIIYCNGTDYRRVTADNP